MEKIYILILFLSSNILLSQQNIEDKFEKTIKEIVTKESTTDKIYNFNDVYFAPRNLGCIDILPEFSKECFQNFINEHIESNFEYPNEAIEEGIQGRVYINFVITSNGIIKDIKIRSPFDILNEPSIRIFNSLPKLIPPLDENNNPINCYFSTAITYRL